MREARRVAARVLDGVGVGESVELLKPACLHLRRSLSPAEYETLDPAWLAIPARDEFTENGAMEPRL